MPDRSVERDAPRQCPLNAVLNGRAKKTFSAPSNSLDYQAIRTETHKYVEYNNGEKELYDLANDPYELDNLYEAADTALLENLKARLEALKSCSEEGCQEAEDAP